MFVSSFYYAGGGTEAYVVVGVFSDRVTARKMAVISGNEHETVNGLGSVIVEVWGPKQDGTFGKLE